jgi:hypothetical protein
MTLETVLTMLLYVAAGWIALLGLKSFQTCRQTHQRGDLVTGLIDVLGSTIAIAYLVWWPLLLAATWLWLMPLVQRSPSD